MRVFLFCMTLVFLNVALAKKTEDFFFRNENYSVSHKVYATHQEIIFNGEIFPLKSDGGIKNLKKRLVPGLDVLLVIGSSGGGYERAFVDFGNALRDVCHSNKRKAVNCKVTTLLEGSCGSACVILYLYGDIRMAAQYSNFGFHRKWLGHPNLVINSAQDTAEKYIKLGANRDWLERNLNIFSDDQVNGTFVRSPDLIDSGIVQEIVGYNGTNIYRQQQEQKKRI